MKNRKKVLSSRKIEPRIFRVPLAPRIRVSLTRLFLPRLVSAILIPAQFFNAFIVPATRWSYERQTPSPPPSPTTYETRHLWIFSFSLLRLLFLSFRVGYPIEKLGQLPFIPAEIAIGRSEDGHEGCCLNCVV